MKRGLGVSNFRGTKLPPAAFAASAAAAYVGWQTARARVAGKIQRRVGKRIMQGRGVRGSGIVRFAAPLHFVYYKCRGFAMQGVWGRQILCAR
jgi:hypothetical protein